MEERTALTTQRAKQWAGALPPKVRGEFLLSSEPMSSKLSDDQFDLWYQAGLSLAKQTPRSWEAAARYFGASPKVIGLMPFSYFVRWWECGSRLCTESPMLARCYFEASPGAMARLRSRHIEAWADLGRRLYKGTWKSGTLSCKFFECSPKLLESLTVPELERFVAFLEALSRRSYDLSEECLALGQKIFPTLGDDKQPFLSLASSIAEKSWRQVKGFFEATSRSLPRIEASQRVRFLRLADHLLKSESINVPAVMLEVSQAMDRLDSTNHERLLELAEGLLDVSPQAIPELIKSSPTVLERVTIGHLEKWVEEGVRVLQENNDGGLAYFRVESAHSQAFVEALSSSVEYERIKDLMEMYCRALAGADVKLAPSEDLAEKNIGWVSNEAPTTEGSTVYVPSLVERYPTKDENFAWYKVVSTHQVAHLEFGSFGFEYDRPSTLFKDMRTELTDIRPGSLELDGAGTQSSDGQGLERAWVTDMQRFFDLFDDRKLALDIFTVVEDGRLDTRVKAEYMGLKRDYLRVQTDSAEGRPDIQSLPMREAMVEFLVRISLRLSKRIPAPKPYVSEARTLARIARRVFTGGATVEDAAEATLRIYAIISQVPNEELPEDQWQDVDVDDETDAGEVDVDENAVLEQLMQAAGDEPEQDEEQPYEPSQEVDYRGDFKPELVQLLARLREQQEGQRGEGETQPITQEMLDELLQSSAEADIEPVKGDLQQAKAALADNVLKEVGMNLPKSPEFGQGPLVHVEEDGGALESTDPETFVYDEWDFRADDYKPGWCVVHQKGMAEGDPDYYGSTLHSYASLVAQVRRQFEMMVPEMFRKVRKLEDGDEIDIDDVIEAFIDMRTGVGPSEKLYWRRNKVQRDVAVVFLLDTSASTAEAIDDSRKVEDDWRAPDDPVEYMVWLRTRRGEGAKRSYKRIIDLEKEAVVLLINALEAIGDIYGIYGFSGYGRENVEFYTIKDIQEQFSEKVKNRIDRIAPLHATRMGPAIRHATSKLETQDARTKLLFLISDGRPQDRGYSREGVEKEYAVHDTKMALDEARAKQITAFCLTVDKNGHDYLKTMCQDIGYEVLDDIYTLPQRLLYLYKSLTM